MKRMRAEESVVAPPSDELTTVGQSVSHGDFVEKVKGALAYAEDWRMPGMLYGRVVRAQVPCARIAAIDVSEAKRLSGVGAVMTARDVPHNQIIEESSGLGFEAIGQPVLVSEQVRYQGEPIALIAADTPTIAEEAAERVVVEYEEMSGVFDVESALSPDAPNVHPGGNRLVEWRFERGDVKTAFQEADVVVEGTYATHVVDHAYLEPEAGVGWMDGDGVLTLRVSTQVIEHAREVAEILHLPQSKVRIIGTYMGGGFGGKEDMTVEPYLALLVWRTRRSVKMVWSRQESLMARQKRHPFRMSYRTAAAQDGRLMAQHVELVGDAGAYPLLSSRVLFAAGVVACGPYDVPNVAIRSTAVFTNNVPTSAFRGFGAMQVVLAYESQMDRVAESLEISPMEVRERNFLEQGGQLPTGESLDTYVGVGDALRTAVQALGSKPSPESDGVRVGRGFACNIQPYGRSRHFSDRASCLIGLQMDGSVLVRTGVTDLGGGQAASLAQIAAEVLGADPARVSVHIGDTALTPLAGGTFATRQLYMSGNAVLKAATELRGRLAAVAAELLGADHALVFAQDRVSTGDEEAAFLTLAELARAAENRGISLQHLGTFDAEGGDFDPRTGRGQTFPDFTYGAHAVDVEVDTLTGRVRVMRYIACHDVGRAINPVRVEGQIQGGVAQGIGYALSEEVLRDQGVNMTGLFADYLIPTSTDVPDVEAIVLEIGKGKGPFGARGIGEPPIGPPAAAIASALHDALGVRLTELPFSPERVMHAIRTAPDSARGET